MSLRAAGGLQSRQGLTVVRPGGNGSTPAPPGLAARLAEAQAEVAGPKRRVAELEGELALAVDASDFARAAQIQDQLPAAREALALATIGLRVVEEQQKALADAEDAERRQIAEARRRDAARKVIEASGDAEARKQAEIDEALDGMRTKLAGARADLQRALAAQAGIQPIRGAAAQAHFDLGEVTPSLDPFTGKPRRVTGPPAVSGENRVSVLADTDALVRELSRWSP